MTPCEGSTVIVAATPDAWVAEAAKHTATVPFPHRRVVELSWEAEQSGLYHVMRANGDRVLTVPLVAGTYWRWIVPPASCIVLPEGEPALVIEGPTAPTRWMMSWLTDDGQIWTTTASGIS